MQLGEGKIQQKCFVARVCVYLRCVLFLGYYGELSKLEQRDFSLVLQSLDCLEKQRRKRS